MYDNTLTSINWDKSQTPSHDYLLPSILKVLNHLNIPSSTKILDAGCGGGYVAHELYSKVYKNIWRFDASESGIEISQNSFPEIKDRFVIHNAYEKKLPKHFPESNYDLVISVEVIEHLYSPKRYLENINRWLKPGGYVLITTPYHGYFKNLAIALINGFDFHHNPLFEGGHIKFFSKNTIYNILKDNSLKPVVFQGSGRLPYIWKSMVVVARKVNN